MKTAPGQYGLEPLIDSGYQLLKVVGVRGFTKGFLPFAPSGSYFAALRTIKFVPDKFVNLYWFKSQILECQNKKEPL